MAENEQKKLSGWRSLASPGQEITVLLDIGGDAPYKYTFVPVIKNEDGTTELNQDAIYNIVEVYGADANAVINGYRSNPNQPISTKHSKGSAVQTTPQTATAESVPQEQPKSGSVNPETTATGQVNREVPAKAEEDKTEDNYLESHPNFGKRRSLIPQVESSTDHISQNVVNMPLAGRSKSVDTNPVTTTAGPESKAASRAEEDKTEVESKPTEQSAGGGTTTNPVTTTTGEGAGAVEKLGATTNPVTTTAGEGAKPDVTNSVTTTAGADEGKSKPAEQPAGKGAAEEPQSPYGDGITREEERRINEEILAGRLQEWVNRSGATALVKSEQPKSGSANPDTTASDQVNKAKGEQTSPLLEKIANTPLGIEHIISLDKPDSLPHTTYNTIIDEVKKSIADGEEPYLALFRRTNAKPERPIENIRAMRNAAKWQAVANALGVLGGAVGAFAGKNGYAGYAPNVTRGGVEGFINKINQLEEDYATLNKQYMDGETRAALYDLQRQIALQDQAEAREYEEQRREEAREYEEQRREESRGYAEQQYEEKREREQMDTAIAWGVFNGSFEDWNALTPKRRAEVLTEAAEKERLYKLPPKSKSTSTKSKPENTIVLPMNNGQSMVVPTAQMNNANWEAVYSAMIGENPSHQAIGNPRYDSYGQVIGHYSPTLQQKIAAIQQHFAESPAAQKRMEEIVGARGKQGVVTTPPSASASDKEKAKAVWDQYKTE